MHSWFGKKMLLRSIVIAGLVTTVAGCSMFSDSEERVVSEDHLYLEAVEAQVISVPQGFEAPSGSEDFYMPKEPAAGPLGEDLDIQAPTQLLALASGSRLDEQNRTSMIWLDQSEVVNNLSKFTWEAIKGYLTGQKVTGSNFDENSTTVETGWVTHVKESSFWSWGTSDVVTNYKYKMALTMRPHGKTAAVSVELSGHQLDGQDVPLSSLTTEQRQRAEIGFLNEFVYHFQILQELRIDKAKRTGSKIITLTTANDADGSPVFHSIKSVDTVWVEMRVLLEGIGFTIDDVDRSVRKLFISYQKPDVGFWDSLWGNSDIPELELTPGEYVIKVTDGIKPGESFVILSDKDEQRLPANNYQAISTQLVDMAKKLGLEL